MANTARNRAPAQKPAPDPMKGFDVLRPFRMAANFISGSISGMLNGMAQWGARGFTVGAIGGALLGIMGGASFFGFVMMGMIGGAFAGIAFGAALGLLTGGFTHAARAQAREDSAQNQQTNLISRSNIIDRVNDSNVERILQQNQENERNQSYWQDRVSGGGPGHGRGF